MALRYAQIELTIEMFLKAFHAEKDKDRRYELIIQFEDSFDDFINSGFSFVVKRENVILGFAMP